MKSSRRPAERPAAQGRHASRPPAPLPSAVAAAWGIREGGTRPRPHGLSLDRIVAAGIRVAATEGLPALSMHRVARELGAATMSLYRHVAAKDDLLAHMVDHAYGEPPGPELAARGWRAGLDRWASAHVEVLRRHRWLLRLPIGGPPLMPNQLLWFERGLACLSDTSLSEAEKPAVLLLVDGFVRSQATLEADIETAGRVSQRSPDTAGSDYARLLDRLTEPTRFPAVRALLDARVFAGPGPIDDPFRFGLDRILDGIARYEGRRTKDEGRGRGQGARGREQGRGE